MLKKYITAILVLLLIVLSVLNVYASENIAILKTIITDTQVFAYINTETADCTAMLGTTPCEIILYSRAGDLPSDTLILVDTSGSIPKAVQDKTSELLSELIDGKIENERYAIASFGTDITYLCDYTSDRYELSKAAGKLEYSEKYTYIYSTINNVLKNISDSVFTKIIVISDGVENSKDGITYDEILRTVSDANCPIYTIGIENNNQENLKKFYSFSRNSAAESFTLTSDTDVSEVCGIVNESRDFTCVEIAVPAEIADGSVKYLSIAGNGFECGCDIRMPVIAAEITESSSITETMPIAEVTDTETEEPVESSDKFNSVIYIAIGIIAAAILIAVIIMICFRKKETSGNEVETETFPPEPEPTVIDNCMIILTDINAPERSFRCALGQGVIVGRDSSQCMIVIDYDKYISRKHCRIFKENGKIFIENYSPNKIIINEQTALENLHSNMQETPSTGTRILLPNANVSAKEIFSGDIIRVGHTSLRFEIK